MVPHFTHEKTEAWGGEVTCRGEAWFGIQVYLLSPFLHDPHHHHHCLLSPSLPNTIVSYPRAESTSLGVVGSHAGRGVPLGFLAFFFSDQILEASSLKAQ